MKLTNSIKNKHSYISHGVTKREIFFTKNIKMLKKILYKNFS